MRRLAPWRRGLLPCALLSAALAACDSSGDTPTGAAAPTARSTPSSAPASSGSAAAFVPEEALVTAGSASDTGAEWLTTGRDYAETHVSPLREITNDNVSRLGLAWYYDTGEVRGHEATPLVANGVLYATTPWSNVFALDARTGEALWRWDAQADRVRGARACCDVVNRGV